MTKFLSHAESSYLYIADRDWQLDRECCQWSYGYAGMLIFTYYVGCDIYYVLAWSILWSLICSMSSLELFGAVISDCQGGSDKVFGWLLAWSQIFCNWHIRVGFWLFGISLFKLFNLYPHFSDVSLCVCLRVYRKSGSNTYDINMDDAAIVGGGFGYPIEIGSKFKLEVL